MTDLEICNNATDGPWRIDEDTKLPEFNVFKGHVCIDSPRWGAFAQVVYKMEDSEEELNYNAEFIAHFNPQKVREMLTYIKELEDWKESVMALYPNIDLDM